MGTWKSGKVRSWMGRQESVKPTGFKMTSYLWLKIFAGMTFLATLWVPFYGYLHVTALLSKYGFQSISIDVDIYRFVLIFLSRIAKGIIDINLSTVAAVLERSWPSLLLVSVVLGVIVLVGVYYSDKRNTIDFSIEARINSYIDDVGLGRFALISGVTVFCLSLIAIPFVYLLIFIVVGALFGVIFLFGVAGYFSGLDMAVETHQKGYCFTEPTVICSQVRVNNYFIDAEVIYADKNRSYLISEEGLMMLSSDQNIVFKLPMSEVDRRLAGEQ